LGGKDSVLGLDALLSVLIIGPEGWLWQHLSDAELPFWFLVITCWANCFMLSWVLIGGCRKLLGRLF
jgi:hypothetical protein